MRILFEKLQFQNFLSYREKQTLPLESQGLVSLEGENLDEFGSNRSGKSAAIPDAIVWTLFGRTIRGVRGAAVVHRRRKKDCFGRVVFRVGKIRYDVRRYLAHKEHKNSLQLFADGKQLSYRHRKQTQEKLEHLLGCNYDNFINSIVFGGVRPFAILSDAEQKKLLQSFLHFEKIDRALRYVRDKLSEFRQAEDGAEKSLLRCEGELSACKAELRSLRENERLWKKQFEKKKEELTRKIDSVSHLQFRDCLADLEKAEKNLKKRQRDRQELESEYKEVRRNMDRREAAKKPQQHYVGMRCPVCHQKVTAESARDSLQHLSSEKHREQARQREILPNLHAIRKSENKASEKLVYWQSRQKAFERERSGKTDLRMELEKQLKQLEKTGPFPMAEKEDVLQSRLSHFLSRRLRLLQKRNTLQNEIEDYAFWERGFGNQGVKALLVRKALPAMNAKLSEYAQEIFGSKVELKFSPSKEKASGDGERELFHLEYKSHYGASSYLGESSGGRRRVDICVLLVFSWLSDLCNLLLVDELLDGLDSPGKEAVLKILSGLRGTVICISHDQAVQEFFPARWHVTKRNGESNIAIKTQI